MAHILIVDDEILIATLLSDCLERFGHTARVARSAVGALGWLDLEEFDVTIVDVMMAGPMDGLDLCRKIKTDPHKARSKVLVTSGVPDMEDSAIGAGADAFLPKPFDLMEIINSVTGLIELNEADWAEHGGFPASYSDRMYTN